MRTSSNVHSAIVAPEFTNLKLYNDGYNVSVNIPISIRVFEMFKDKPFGHKLISFKGKYYIHWDKSYQYSTPFISAYIEAQSHLIDMKIEGREYKISILRDEIYIISHPKIL